MSLIGYTLATTVGWHVVPLMLFSIISLGLFLVVELNATSPLIKMSALGNWEMSSSLLMNVVVATVMMTTLVVGPFYLSRALSLSPALVGLTMSVGPFISILSGFPSGRAVDRVGPHFILMVGLSLMVIGLLLMSAVSHIYGVTGYIFAISFLTPGYQLFQAANNTAVMMNVPADQRGAISGMLTLSRNMGLISGASLMGAVFASASGSVDIATGRPSEIAIGMHWTFLTAACLIAVALAMSIFRRTPKSKRV